MKKTAIILMLALIMQSCKKETARNYGVLNRKIQSVQLLTLDSTKSAQIYQAFSTERTVFLTRLEQDYPGLMAQMESDVSLIIGATDSATREALIQDFDQSYYQQVKTTWNNTGINVTDIENKYRLLLGNDIPFIVGEFGTLLINQSDEANTVIPSFADDTIMSFINWGLNWHDDACGGFSSNSILVNVFGNTTHLAAATAAGCGIDANHTQTIHIPSGIYKYVTATSKFNYSFLDCISFAVLGGGTASSKITYSLEHNGELLNQRDYYSVSVIAPIIWYARAQRSIPFSTTMTISAADANAFPGGIVKLKSTVNNFAASGGVITGSFSDSQVTTSSFKISLTL
ncbi:MAG: hypothetical protein U0T74_10660 [Chitinophagales bacterium]